MADIGYECVKCHIYRAEWSTLEVEHFVYFQIYGTQGEYLAADFGIRNEEAESFAVRSIQAYGGDIYQLLRHDDRTDCFMRFSIGELASWGGNSSLKLSTMLVAEISEKIKDDIVQQLFPFVRSVTGANRLLSLLLLDVEPYPWIRCNGAMRAAMIVNLALGLGIHPKEIHGLLGPHNKQIALHLRKAPDRDPSSYIERVINDAASNAAHLNNSAGRDFGS